ncbi:MAG: glycoside hydrolase family 2 protein [Bacteroidetes bacterium]|nr:MAG: glycoside hydrolase family 2 protein [Bacteroidota bacterium]
MISKFFPTVLFILLNFVTIAQVRTVELISDGWKFQKGEQSQAHLPEFDDSGWENVKVPHDWAIAGPFEVEGDGNTGKLPWKGQGWYRKTLDLPQSLKGKRLYLIFDGVMAFPKVYINGKFAGEWDYGYNSFYLDITDFVNPEEPNLLAVHADTRPHDSRWYPGAGIYRKVQLVAVNPVHVDIWGTYITTPIVKPHFADVQLATTVNNFSGQEKEVKVVHMLINAMGNVVTSKEIKDLILADRQKVLETTITLANPRLWDIDDPHLYTVKTKIYDTNKLVDEYESTFGVRTIRFTADHGFYLNDCRVQLKGVNLHHDLGPLGAAFNKRAMERQLEIMKDMGCNAVRSSHNTPAPELLDLCDQMGLLFVNEIFDKYDAKAGIVDTTDFDDFTHRNMRNFVVRDRNHPSIFLWSVGNEIGDVQWNIKGGFHKLRTMINYLEKYDDTRPNTLVCDSKQSATLGHWKYYDVHSWNYGRRYSLARQLEPNKSVIISESASTLSTRGFYEFPLPEDKTAFTNSLQVSSYDLNAPYWAEVADDDFMWQQQEPYIAGEFVWTGFDYLGEPTPYNNKWVKEKGMTDKEASRSSYFGIVDLCGIPKDRYYLYKSYWKPEETTIHILPHWNWSDRVGEVTPVFVYTNGDCAELFLNGKSLGKQCKDPKSNNSVERFRLMWKDVIYEPGELLVVAYKEGIEIGRQTMKTAGEPHALRITPDRIELSADGEDLSFVLVEAIDKDGMPCPLANEELRVKVKGAGKLLAVGNGNPQSMNAFSSETVDLFFGKAMVIIGAETAPGEIEVDIRASGLKSKKITIKSK